MWKRMLVRRLLQLHPLTAATKRCSATLSFVALRRFLPMSTMMLTVACCKPRHVAVHAHIHHRVTCSGIVPSRLLLAPKRFDSRGRRGSIKPQQRKRPASQKSHKIIRRKPSSVKSGKSNVKSCVRRAAKGSTNAYRKRSTSSATASSTSSNKPSDMRSHLKESRLTSSTKHKEPIKSSGAKHAFTAEKPEAEDRIAKRVDSKSVFSRLGRNPRLCRKLARILEARRAYPNAVLPPVPVAVEKWLQSRGYIVNDDGRAAEVATLPSSHKGVHHSPLHTLEATESEPLLSSADAADADAAIAETDFLYDREAMQEEDARIAMRSLMAQHYRTYRRPISEEFALRRQKLAEIRAPHHDRRTTQATNASALSRLPVSTFLPPVDTHEPLPEPLQHQQSIAQVYSDDFDRRVDPATPALHHESLGDTMDDPLLGMLHDGAVSLTPPVAQPPVSSSAFDMRDEDGDDVHVSCMHDEADNDMSRRRRP